MLSAIEAACRVEASHGEHTPIWITELGWATGGPPAPCVGERRQAALIRDTFAELVRRRRELRLPRSRLLQLERCAPFAGAGFFGLHTGLLRIDGSAKPALAAYVDAARR